jgi:hypothetical protein
MVNAASAVPIPEQGSSEALACPSAAKTANFLPKNLIVG